jgi:hypothetical protein
MARAPGPLCQTSCRLNRIGTLGAQEDESGSIRTSVQKSGSCEAVATGEAVDALVYLILGVAGDGIEQPKVHYVGGLSRCPRLF